MYVQTHTYICMHRYIYICIYIHMYRIWQINTFGFLGYERQRTTRYNTYPSMYVNGQKKNNRLCLVYCTVSTDIYVYVHILYNNRFQFV